MRASEGLPFDCEACPFELWALPGSPNAVNASAKRIAESLARTVLLLREFLVGQLRRGLDQRDVVRVAERQGQATALLRLGDDLRLLDAGAERDRAAASEALL